MSRRVELRPPLAGRAFAVRDARAAGVPMRRLAAHDLAALAHGARVPVGGSTLDAVGAVLGPGQAFTGPTAAKIWGMPLPRRWQDDPRIWVSTPSRDRTMRRPGVVGSRRSSGDPLHVFGHPVLDAARTWCSLAPLLSSHDLVAVGDRIVTSSPRTRALAAPEDLYEAVGRARRGTLALRSALGEMRVGSWSRTESLLRVALTRAGLPEARLNEPIVLPGGRTAVPDLAWPEFQVCVEYDGEWHDDPRQRAADLERHELVTDLGWLVTHIRPGDLFPEPLVAVARILRRLTSRGYHHSGHVERAEKPGWFP